MRTRDEIEAALHKLGWTLESLTRTASGWKGTVRHGAASVLMTNATEIAVLEDLLRHAQLHSRRKP